MYSIICLQVYNVVIHSFQRLYSICNYCRVLVVFRLLCKVAWKVIYFTQSSFYLLLPSPTSSFPPSLPPLVTTSLFSVSWSLLLFCHIH